MAFSAATQLGATQQRLAMRILHITPFYSPAVGGAEWHAQRVSEQLASRGHEVTVMTSNVASVWSPTFADLPPRETLNGVRIERFHPKGGRVGGALRAWQKMRGGYRSTRWLFGGDGRDLVCAHPALLQLIPLLAKKAQADIVSTFNWRWAPAYHAYLARKLRHFPMVAVPLFHPAEDWAHRPVHKKMLEKCAAAVVCTAYEARFVSKLAKIPIEVAGVGVDVEDFRARNGAAVRARYRLGSFPVVGFVGRQDSGKGADTVLCAMKTVWRSNAEARLLLAGHQPRPDSRLESLFGNLTNFERERIVRIHDFPTHEKASIYDALDVFVMPSLAESFGIAYLDAWMCQKPVIGARIGPTQCVIEEGRDGLLVAPQDPEDTARAILDLLSNPDKREVMGRRGREKTLNAFTLDKVTARVEKFYLALSARKNGHSPSHTF